MKKLILFFVLFISVHSLFSQNNFFNPISTVSKIPKSPEVAAFGTFATSVNMYNGVPTIRIPLYTLQGKEISVPVSLSYDASGIKVDQIATNVGLGWNLNYGGVVSRNVNGLPDDYISDGGGHPANKIYDQSTRGWVNYLAGHGNIHGQHPDELGATKAKNAYEAYQDNNVDLQPDTFSFNVNGLSGTIFIDYDTNLGGNQYKAFCLEDPYIKVEYYQNDKFIITDTAGNIYTFGNDQSGNSKEHTYHKTSPTGQTADEYQTQYIAAWYLTEIKSVNGLDTFTFDYSNDTWNDRDIRAPLQQLEVKHISGCNQGVIQTFPAKDLGYNDYFKDQVRLNKISYTDATGDTRDVLTTNSENNRDDLDNVHRIKGLNIYDRINPATTGNELLKIDFDNDHYFGDTTKTSEYVRLKLNAISIYRDNSTDPKKYVFDYNNPEDVPWRKSKGVDFWGYYNGRDTNLDFAPDPTLDNSDIANYDFEISPSISISGYSGSNRRPVFSSTKIGSLKSIVYPTGGKTSYEYEEHRDNQDDGSGEGKVVGGLRLRSVTNSTEDLESGENFSYQTYYYYGDLHDEVTNNGLTTPNGSIPEDYISSGITQQDLLFSEYKEVDLPAASPDCPDKSFIYTQNRSVITPYTITYSSVSEIRFNNGQFEGTTITDFYNDIFDGGQGIADRFRPFKNVNLNYGDVETQRVYDKDFNLLKKTTSEISIVTLTSAQSGIPEYSGVRVYQGSTSNGGGSTGGGGPACIKFAANGSGWTFNLQLKDLACATGYINYPISSEGYSHFYETPGYGYKQLWKRLDKSKTISYENGQSMESETTYTYNGTNHNFPTLTITQDSKGNNIRNKTIYPSDSGLLINYPAASLGKLQDMVARNQLNVPVEVRQAYQITQLNNTNYDEISAQRRIFDDFTPSGQSNGFSLIQPSKVQVSKGTADFEDRILFHEYDAYGNLTEVSYPPTSAIRHTYVWGYKGDQLLAEVKNASLPAMDVSTQSAINTIINDSNVENTQAEEDDLRDDLNDLRVLSDFEDTQLSVYTYDPGIGVTSITDIRNYTSYYYYDQHNRIEYSTDEDGMMLGKNEYKYRVNTSEDENSIKTTRYRNAFTIAQINNGTALDNERLENISYSDGMGRVKQNIGLRAGGNRENIVQYTEYDNLGRETKQYLPYAAAISGSDYIPLATAANGTNSFYNTLKYENTTNPYSENILEKSPRSRVLETGAPGSHWFANPTSDTDRTIKNEYAFNNGVEVMRFSVTYVSQGADPQLVYENYYSANELSKTTLKDENWQPSDGLNNLTQTFTNKSGQVLLKRQRVYDANRTTDQTYQVNTYYIYDDFGSLVYVLSPEGSDKIVASGALVSNYQTILDQWCYQYKYDDRNRIIQKKIPGRGEELIFYDALDRPVLTQDANQRVNDEFSFVKYDIFDRPVYTGIYTSPTSNPTRAQIENDIATSDLHENVTANAMDIDGTDVFYTKDVFPETNVEVLTVAYYDDYIDTATVGSPPSTTSYGETITLRRKGLSTVSKVKVLHDNPTEDWITTVTGYDEKARPIYIKSENPYLQKTGLSESQLDFTGKVMESASVHYDDSGNNADITIIDYFNYDHVGRLLNHEQKIDDSPVQLIAENVYDEMGQMLQKNVGGETYVDGYTDMHNVDVSTDQIIENVASVTGWNAYLKTRGEVLAEGGVSFKALDSDKELKVGFFKIGQTLVPVDYLHYGIYLTNIVGSGGKKKVKYVVNGAEYFPSSEVTYTANDTFKVERIDVGQGVFEIHFFKNNSSTSFASVTTNVTTNPMIGKAVFHSPGAKITDFDLLGNNIDKILQEIDYKYNVRGWITDINNVDGPSSLPDTDLFSLRINYNKAVAGTASVPSLYNGNISQTVWMSTIDDTKRSYAYEYDQLNRLIDAQGRKGVSLNTATDFNVNNITYDKNGNIGTLKRYGKDPNSSLPLIWDDLSYVYSGNQLQGVGEAGSYTEGFRGNSAFPQTSYSYDVNGNMTSDAYKGLSITYNHLDLPEVISTNSGNQNESITYVYDANGIKLSKSHIDEGNNVTLYAGGFVYSGQGVATDLQFIAQPEGYIMPVSVSNGGVTGFDKGNNTTTYSSYDYVFQFVDHLGNIRLSYSDKDKDGSIATDEIIEESNYYPFGLKHLGYNDVVYGGNGLAQAWKYNGKEFSSELGMDFYEMDLRKYDPTIARWTSIDPVTHHSMSTYSAFDNNPVFWADPSGADSEGSTTQNFGGTPIGASAGHTDSAGFSFYSSDAAVAASARRNDTNPWKRYFRNMRKNAPDFSLSGTGSGGPISQVYNGSIDGGKAYFSDLLSYPSRVKQEFYNTLNNPFGQAKKVYIDEGGLKYLIPGYGLYALFYKPIIDSGTSAVNLATSYYEGDYYEGAYNLAYNETGPKLLGAAITGISLGTIKGLNLISQIRLPPSSGFYKLHPRITNPWYKNNGGYGKGQFDNAHRGATWHRETILRTGKYRFRAWNDIWVTKEIGGKWYSIGINPWKRWIYHEGPGK